MFGNKKSILFITRSKIKVASVTLGKQPKEKIFATLDWTPETLPDILSRLQKSIKGSVRILLDEDFVYTVNVTVPAGSVSRDIVKKIAQELIPENLDETAWDFRVIGAFARVQVVAVSYAMFAMLKKSIAKAGLHIEAIEPLSFALARFSRKLDKPVIYVYIDESEIIVIFAQEGIVMGTKEFSAIDLDAINQFRAFVKERFTIAPKDVIFCGNTSGVSLAKFASNTFKAYIQNISPIVSLALKEDIKGKDEKVLNLELLDTVPLVKEQARSKIVVNASQHLEGFQPLVSEELRQHSKRTRKKVIIGLVVAVLMLGIAGGVFFYTNIPSKKTEDTVKSTIPKAAIKPSPDQEQINPTATSSATPSATSSANIDLSSYTITVLNGSGKAGEAGRLEKVLEDNGFNVTETGNADSSDYEKTEVLFKERVPDEAKLPLDKLLKSIYSLDIEKNLEENAETDIVIIIGKILGS